MKVTKAIQMLNDLLGDRMGWTPNSSDSTSNTSGGRQPIFRWDWSEDLFWPAFKTGHMVNRRVPAMLLGESGNVETDAFFAPAPEDPGVTYVNMLVPEYARVKLSNRLKNQWVATKWFPPEELPQWERNFPQAPYPKDGYRIHTNACLPPFQEPTLLDTEDLIKCLREQRSMTFADRLIDMERDRDQREKSKHGAVLDEIDDLIPAYGNYAPGKRGHFISFPSTQKEITIGSKSKR